MGATIHVIWAMLLIVLLSLIMAKFGKKPKSFHRPLVSLILAFFIGCFGFIFTVVGSREGTQSAHHFFMYFIGSWLLLTFIESKKRASLLTLGLFVYVLCHRFEYMSLAASSYYTDNPKHRFEMIKELNEVRQDKGLAHFKNVKVKRAWHTWITDLYEVQPPAGGGSDFRDLDDLPDKPQKSPVLVFSARIG